MGYSLWKRYPALTFILSLLAVPCCHGGKILVFPVDGSHWLNMNILIEELHGQGHDITVVHSKTSRYIKEKSPHYTSITVTLPAGLNFESEDFMTSLLKKMLEFRRGEGSLLSLISMQMENFEMLSNLHRGMCQMVVTMFEDQRFMKKLQDAHFDLVLTDPGLPGGVLLAHYLKLPMVFNVRWLTSGEAHFSIAPSPISYVPTPGTELSDQMDLIQRARNMLQYSINLYLDKYVISPHYDALCARYFGPGVDLFSLLLSADLWLMRANFVFEFPRPTMPNIVYIGGFQCNPAKPLPQDLEEFMESSGEHGVVVMSLGTLVNGLPSELTDKIAYAFSQLPQKVIWRHLGERPSSLGNNTLLVKWLPQNDLLGHPKTKAFVAHGGTNGVYEAIYHGVPIVGLPLLFDQFDNLLRMQVRGAAKVLEVTTLGSKDFLQALKEVLEEPSYQMNMKRLSSLQRDQPVKPMDSALFWIEYVMRNKGAAHLRTESYRMPCFSQRSYRWVQTMVFAINEINQNATLLPNLTLGFGIYDTCGAVHRGIEGALWMMSGQEVLVPGYRCLPGTPLAAIIGDAGSRISLAIARILGLYSYPLISYFATVPQLSDRRQFPSFFRTIPSDVFQVQGLVRLMQHFGWSWLGLLASEDDYGQMGSQILQKELLQSGACLAFHETVPLLYDKRKIQHIVQVVKSSSAKAIIVFTFESFLMPVVVKMARQNVTGKVWVATEGWSTSHNLANRELLKTMDGTIGFAIRRADIPGLKEHLLSVSPNSPTGSTNQYTANSVKESSNNSLRETGTANTTKRTEESKSLVKLFWEEMFKCKWPDIQDNLGGSQQLCTGQENLSQLGMATAYSDVSNLRISYNIYNAVYAAAHALHDLHSCQPGEGPFANGGCANIRDFEPWQLLHYIKKVRFNNNAKEEVHFDENGISPTRYDILNWQKNPTGDIQYVKIGSFDYSAPSGRDLEINESAIIWNGGQTQTLVIDNRQSELSFSPSFSRPWLLIIDSLSSLSPLRSPEDSTECLHCPEGSWSNKQRDSCIPKVVEFLSYTEPLGAVLASLSVLTSLLPASTLALFLWHHHTPIVKANNRQLSYVLLCALALCPLCSLIFIGQPSPASCTLRQTAFGIIFALSVSCVLAKTVLVVIAFKASIPGSSLHRWVGTRLPNSIACLGTLIQVGICGTWLGAAPPFPENNIKSQIGKVILECNEGSALAFWCMLGYMGILASVSFVVAFLSRNLPDSFNEAKFITFSMLVFVKSAKATIITQRPLLIVKKGDSAVLDCEQDGSDNTMSWYRQSPDKGLELIYYSAAPRSEERQQSIPDRFTAKRSVLKTFPLNIKTLQAGDSAVYFCASSHSVRK
ncbi:UNVERIFIED_CONTAM: hypothetical protein FKN15_031857 [Acipenser sinensis]